MGWVVSTTPLPRHLRGRPGTRFIGGWVDLTSGLHGYGKSRPSGIGSPARSARSESLYRLSYPGHGSFGMYDKFHRGKDVQWNLELRPA
jgi:hypothetical protein